MINATVRTGHHFGEDSAFRAGCKRQHRSYLPGRRARATRPVAQLLRRQTRRGRYNLWPRRWLITCGAAYSRVLEPLGYVSFETRFTLCASSGSAPGAAETWDGYLNDINGTYVTESWGHDMYQARG